MCAVDTVTLCVCAVDTVTLCVYKCVMDTVTLCVYKCVMDTVTLCVYKCVVDRKITLGSHTSYDMGYFRNIGYFSSIIRCYIMCATLHHITIHLS